MPSFNRVTLMGNPTRDPQVKQLPNTTVAEFGLAVNRRFKTQAGEDREEVCYVDCTAFGKQADTIAQYCQKGRPLFVEGRLTFSSWEDKAGGKRSKLTVTVENFQFLGQRENGGGDDRATAGSSRQHDEPPGSTTLPPHQRKPPQRGPSQRPPAGRPSDQLPIESPPFGEAVEFDPDSIPF
jgi:single-strand DNA-binding protein